MSEHSVQTAGFGESKKIDFVFLDSGTGGIPYMLALKQKNPAARCVYVGDTAHFPYGEKTPDAVTECASFVIRLIVERWRPGAVVIACNTISVTALDSLREQFPLLPIVGTVPAIKLAASVTRNKRIGLLATNATVRHPYCQRLIADFANDCTVFSRGDPDLVWFVEHDLFSASQEERQKAVRPAVSFFSERGCDTIILGCTHFTHISGDITKAAGNAVKVVDSRDGVANQALRVEQGEFAGDKMPMFPLPPDMSFFVTACTNVQQQEYMMLCEHLHIPFGGLMPVGNSC